jgi:hypothetical protein
MIGGSFPEVSTACVPADGALETLSRLHARTLQYCATLRRLVSYLAECDCDEQARNAAHSVLTYFDVYGPRDSIDEEQDLFPALLESMAGSDAVCLREITAGMVQEHRTLESMWDRLRQPLAVIATGKREPLDGAEVEAFVHLYHSHIEREQSELLPMAARLLTDEALEQVWKSMRARHGV